MNDRNDKDQLHAARQRRRRGLVIHFALYLAVMAVLVPVNAWLAPGRPWFIVPLVGWGAPLAVHTAWVMELFGPPKA